MTNAEFCQQYDSVLDKLQAFAMKLTRNPEQAKDLMQETAERAFNNKNRFQVGTNFRAWITTIMRNTFINEYRKNRNRDKLETPIHKLLFVLKSESSNNGAESRLTKEELERVIGQLKEKHRKIFSMYYQGYHYDEISDEMDLPIGTVKSRLFYARKELKKHIKTIYN